ncbi:cystathionine gamma-lyase-like [Saccoglossus kowalevskii]|uniref:cystathionine gamma-lyase n=1 Tax=Saccoglossus kowalevskii TaxID=10224 RepID=A0ABM0GZP9_SACKO|nr:PREDICTED: cystathionine gamma-lyase-like [Saccoglossus kowalevskii]
MVAVILLVEVAAALKFNSHLSRGAFLSRLFSLSLTPNMAEKQTTFPHFATQAIHVGQEPEQWKSLAVVPKISLATTFKQESPGVHSGFEYGRSGNPTRSCFETCVAALEGGKHCMSFSSGLAATTSLTHLLSAGDHILCIDDVYGGTNRYFQQCAKKMNIETSFVDCTVIDNVKQAVKPNTKMVWIETPTNPLMKLADIKAISDVIHENHEGVFIVVDNTFASPYFQRPLELGADVVLHSVSKYINGHSDVIMGLVVTSDEDLHKRLRFLQNALGGVPSPFDCYLANRGLKTLHVRMREHQRNAFAVARYLEKSPKVLETIFPGLESHPQYELGLRQMKGYSGMISFRIKGGVEEATTFLKSVKVFTLAESLGGFESLCEHPAIMTHSSVPEEARKVLGITDNLIRLSVGIEDTEDIIADIEQALNAAVPDSK